MFTFPTRWANEATPSIANLWFYSLSSDEFFGLQVNWNASVHSLTPLITIQKSDLLTTRSLHSMLPPTHKNAVNRRHDISPEETALGVGVVHKVMARVRTKYGQNLAWNLAPNTRMTTITAVTSVMLGLSSGHAQIRFCLLWFHICQTTWQRGQAYIVIGIAWVWT